MRNIKQIYRALLLFVLIAGFNACTTDDLDPTLEQSKNAEGGITSADNMYALIKGAYSTITDNGYYGRDYIINNEVRTDNCYSNGNSGRFTTQASLEYSPNSGFFWDEAYAAIAACNILINLDPSTLEGDQDYIAHLQGQALALRALAHFDLVKQYGQQNAGGTLGVPYVKEFKGDDLIPARNTVEEVKTAIFEDLTAAYTKMSADYTDKEFITKLAAKAIESRVAIYFKDWTRALSACEIVINSDAYSIIPANDYVAHWQADKSANSIFELAFSDTDNEGIDGLAYIYRTGGSGSYGDVQVINEVEPIYSANDVRAGILGYEGDKLRNIGKYPDNNGVDNVIVIRYEEVILNYAEALLETNSPGDALTQINLITSNRNADAYTSVTKDDLLNERRKEFIFEGMRFDDLMRTGKDIEKLYFQQLFDETISYGDYRLAWPIPQSEIDANSNMVQNTGY